MTLIFGSAWLLLLAGCSLILETEATDYNKPVSPEEMSALMGGGFAVSFFKPQPLAKYDDQNIEDVYDAGFRNVRIRCPAWMYPPYETANFTKFLNGLETIVDKCLEVRVIPIISWAHNTAIYLATDEDRGHYVTWWSLVAERLKNKDYRVCFNLFTELINAKCKKILNCTTGSLNNNTAKYNNWTAQAIAAIRGSGGKNEERILILASPKKGAWGLDLINDTFIDDYMMAEHHQYASGPTALRAHTNKYWTGNGTAEQRQHVLDELDIAKNHTRLKTYWGAWMPNDNKKHSLNQDEVENFARYFVSTLKSREVPWSLNQLGWYYDTRDAVWLTGLHEKQNITFSKVLEAIQEVL